MKCYLVKRISWAAIVFAVSIPCISAHAELLSEIIRRDKIVIGVKDYFPLFGDKNPQTGELEGINIDIARALAKKLLGDENKIEFKLANSKSGPKELNSGEIDLLDMTLPINETFAKQVDISEPYMIAGTALLVRTDSGIYGIDDIKEGTVVLNVKSNLDKDILKKMAPKARYFEYPDNESAFEALLKGEGDAVPQVTPNLYPFAKQHPEFHVVGRFTDKPYGLAVKKGETALLQYVNEFLREFRGSGEADKVFKKWLGDSYEGTAWDEIKKRGKLIVGVNYDFPLFGMRDAKTGEWSGIDVDIARMLAKKLLGDEKNVEFKEINDDTRVKMVQNKEIDLMIATLVVNDENKKLVDMSEPYFTSGSALLAKKGSGIKSIDDIKKGTKVLFKRINPDRLKIKAKAPEATYIEVEENEDGYRALLAGEGDVYTQVVPTLYDFAKQNPEYEVVGRFTDKNYGIVARKGEHELISHVNGFLNEVKSDGELEKVFNKWIGENYDKNKYFSETLDNIKKRDKLVVGTTFSYPLFNSKNPKTGQYEGFLVDVSKLLAKKILGDENKLELKYNDPNGVAKRFEPLSKGEVDVLIDTLPMYARKQYANVSDPIVTSGSSLMVRKNGPVKSINDIKKGTVILYEKPNPDISVLKELAPDATYIEYEDNAKALQAFREGKGDAYGHIITGIFKEAVNNPDITVVGRYTSKPYGIVSKKSDIGMLAFTSDFVKSSQESGELDKIFDKWFGAYGGSSIKKLITK